MIEKFEQRLRELEAKATPGPVFVAEDRASDCPPHQDSGLALIDTGRHEDWPIARLMEWGEARKIAFLYDAGPEIAGLVEACRQLRNDGSFHESCPVCKAIDALDAKVRP